MGSSTNYNEDYQPESPGTDGTPDGVDLAEEGGGELEKKDIAEEASLTVRLASVNLEVRKQTSIGDTVTVSGREVRVTGDVLGYLNLQDAEKAQSRGLDSGHVKGLPDTPKPTAIIVLTP
ncbi:hypothetical protein BSZ35_00040 [Salinibacter sp. 10B]|uniref:hypothetical protein n=1 Tax=Salinibacter sp. 10B TaxID=1923971 RepID=UPI000CF3DCE4|nr:hypothetical protein [Salinibacter sp. 10B]PQJ36779.1 hypothetical protein BSZ35_00040 [Salinibacter sp. 10B]